MKLALRYTIYSQVVLALSLIICTIISPHFLFSSNEGGVSNYAVHAATIVPTTLGFLGCALLLVTAARHLARDSYSARFAPWLKLAAAGYALVLLSSYPYKLNGFFDKTHVYISLAFAVFLLIATVRLVRYNHLDKLGVLAMTLVLGGFALGIATLANATHVLFMSQTLIGFGFGMTLIHTVRLLTLRAHSKARITTKLSA